MKARQPEWPSSLEMSLSKQDLFLCRQKPKQFQLCFFFFCFGGVSSGVNSLNSNVDGNVCDFYIPIASKCLQTVPVSRGHMCKIQRTYEVRISEDIRYPSCTASLLHSSHEHHYADKAVEKGKAVWLSRTHQRRWAWTLGGEGIWRTATPLFFLRENANSI